MTLSYSHTDEYLANHHRTFIWRWMEIETESHAGAPDRALNVPVRSRRKENMSKEVRTTRGAPTHEYTGADPPGAHQGQLYCDGKSM